MMDIFTPALDWLKRGVSVIPCRSDKTPAFAWKHFVTHLPTEQQVKAWLNVWPSYGVILGWRGLHVIDFDDLAVYARWESPLKASYSVLTARGIHVYVYARQGCRIAHLRGVDILSAGAYVLGAGSLHPSGAIYTALEAPVMLIDQMMPEVNRLLSIAGGQATEPKHASPALLSRRTSTGAIADVKATVRACDLLSTPILATGPGWGITNCPLHDDRHPSLAVNLRTGDVKCLAGCANGRWQDAIGLYAYWHDVTPRQAIKELTQ